jgi:hypothetical protein
LAEFVEIQIEAGATFSTEITVNDALGGPKNLADYTVRSQMRKSYYSTTAIDFTMTVVDAPAGVVTMVLSASQTSNIRPGRYVYDVEIVENNTQEVTRIFEGIITVLPNVTR